MAFKKLTSPALNSVYINMEYVVSMKPSDLGCTQLTLMQQGLIYVQETVEEIMSAEPLYVCEGNK